MTYAWYQDLPIDKETYERIRIAIGEDEPAGLIVHLVTHSPNGHGLRYIDVWESKEDCDRFTADRVHPILGTIFASAGKAMPAEPPREEIEMIDLFGSGLAKKR